MLIALLLLLLLVPGLSVSHRSPNKPRVGVAPLPNWPPTWEMKKSTIVQPCNDSGFLDIALHSQFAIVDIDWSNAKALWVQPPMMCEELLLTQVALLKAANPDMRVFVYRNYVKALPWYSSVRDRLADPASQDWFLKFKPNSTYHVPQCDNNFSPPKCTQFYHDQEQTPGYPHGDGNCPGPCDCGPVPCGEYLWDHVNGGDALRSWIVNDFVLGPTGLGNPNVSGFFFDDGWHNTSQPIKPFEPKIGYCDHAEYGGPTEENFYCTEDMGLTQADTNALTSAYREMDEAVHAAVIAAGGWAWQLFYEVNTPSNETCAVTLRDACSKGENASYYSAAIQHSFTKHPSGAPVPLPKADEDLAVFLLWRGPYAWLGYGWVGCNVQYVYPDALKADYGTPLGTCEETGVNSGVFVRKYTKALVQMDCNTYTGTVTQI